MSQATLRRYSWIWRTLGVLGNVIICAAILAGAVWAVRYINDTEPVAEKVNATRKSMALVDTITVSRGTYSPKLIVLGTVQPAQDITLSPRVGGQVTKLSPKFVPGGLVREGDLLLQIDPADFKNALEISQNELKKAEASMQIEKARQELARKELTMLEGTIDGTNQALVLREPQIASIQADIDAAKASIARAQLNLDRTKVYAPFDAQVLTQAVNIGSQVSSGNELGRLIGLDEYWVMAAVPVRNLRMLEFPDPAKIDDSDMYEENEVEIATGVVDENPEMNDLEKTGSKVTLRNPDAWGAGQEREGRVARMIGTLNQETRLARVLITVKDPLAQKSDKPKLILDTLIETEIEGLPIENVFRLNREHVHDEDIVWVMKDSKLELRKTVVVFRDAQYAYIEKGLDDGDEVVTTTLATVANGVGLRKRSEEGNSEDAEANNASDEEAAE